MTGPGGPGGRPSNRINNDTTSNNTSEKRTELIARNMEVRPLAWCWTQTTRRSMPSKNANPLTYPQSDAPFNYDLFNKPTSEYRGCPLWAWNSKLDKETMKRQIGCLQEMGFGGFHMHVRTGLDTEYMGEEFMDVVKTCVEVAEEKKMLACLYDDDRWPSGVAGGKVIESNPKHKGKHLLFTKIPYGHGQVGRCTPSSAAACRSENGTLVARYGILLNEDGTLSLSRFLSPKDKPIGAETVWYAYEETNPPSPWFNGQTYVDTLSKAAIADFIKITHEKYKECVGDKFGSTVPCIFTDEPQFATKTRLNDPFDGTDQFLPWTDDLMKSLREAHGKQQSYLDLLACLPELFWNKPDGKFSLFRYRFHNHVCETFVSAFMDQLGKWCMENNILLNGHMMEEPTLESQTHSLGEAMRCYRSQTLPGIDLLSDMVEYNTAKQASSVARQSGRRGCMSELYGCTHWDFTFEGHKGQGDWQAALGITFRVPHLAWASMAGEAKRDYPASLNYQSPWFREYGYIEDHFARVGVAMTRGRPVTRVAVIHPIESYWLVYGPGNDPGGEMVKRNQWFEELTGWLLHGLIDFDFISESLLPNQFRGVNKGCVGPSLQIGECAYDAVIMPNLLTVRSTTFRILQDFISRGGEVIIAGDAPKLEDAEHKMRWRYGNQVPWNREMILTALAPFRELEVSVAGSGEQGEALLYQKRADTLLYQMRQDGDERFVFICNTNRTSAVDTEITLTGHWNVERLDSLTGEHTPLNVCKYTRKVRLQMCCDKHFGQYTSFRHKFEGCGSVLLHLRPSPWKKPERLLNSPQSTGEQVVPLKLRGMKLVEDGTKHSGLNVLMLDYAKYLLDDASGEWSHVQEILALNNEILQRLGLPTKGMAWRQPWTLSPADRAPRGRIFLEFRFGSDFDVSTEAYVALELPEGEILVTLNGVVLVGRGIPQVNGIPPSADDLSKQNGNWFVDEAITTVPLPPNTIQSGENVFTIMCSVGVLTPIERVYVLGNFKVRRAYKPDREDPVKAMIRSYANDPHKSWGDITEQGFPFYPGNITYKCTLTLEARAQATLRVPKFSSPVLTVIWGKHKHRRKGYIALQPRQLDLGILDAGTHDLYITAYGNRYNSFGHIHTWITNCWPDAWRTQGWAWTDDYLVKPIGVLECPTVLLTSAPETASAPGIASQREADWGYVLSPILAQPRSTSWPWNEDGARFGSIGTSWVVPQVSASAISSSSWIRVPGSTRSAPSSESAIPVPAPEQFASNSPAMGDKTFARLISRSSWASGRGPAPPRSLIHAPSRATVSLKVDRGYVTPDLDALGTLTSLCGMAGKASLESSNNTRPGTPASGIEPFPPPQLETPLPTPEELQHTGDPHDPSSQEEMESFLSLHMQVASARTKLGQLWTELRIPEDTRLRFEPAYSDVINEDVLWMLIEEIEKLKDVLVKCRGSRNHTQRQMAPTQNASRQTPESQIDLAP
ncbi:hypothetical protein GE09DRAFT_691875 [Coniochaeta sp. 2T2.1]|nr:hypothetical protein GE09DRAFT_691875 [Coniochaeta sp. 2T2.1]